MAGQAKRPTSQSPVPEHPVPEHPVPEHQGSVSKERLLHAAMDYAAAHGVADLSLRKLAAEIGTSHRMLLYHFGSKEELLIEVVRSVEARQRQLLTGLDVDPALSPNEAMRRLWQHLSDPAMWPNERLFFETYGQALQARPRTARFLDDIVESWLGPAAEARRSQGVPRAVSRAQARLDVALTRGLLLDLLATRDRAGADAAIEQYIALFEAWRATIPGEAPTGARTVTRVIESPADPDALFAVIADPRRLPEWAPGFADAVGGSREAGWQVTKAGDTFALRVAVAPDARAVDLLREIAPGREAGAYLRVQPRPGGGSVAMITAPVPPDGDRAEVAVTLDAELRALERLARARRGSPR